MICLPYNKGLQKIPSSAYHPCNHRISERCVQSGNMLCHAILCIEAGKVLMYVCDVIYQGIHTNCTIPTEMKNDD